jgi:hypothetical protein
MDISIEFRKRKPKYERKWVIGAYNAYFHNNPYFIIADQDLVVQDDGSERIEPVFKEISILPIVPSVSYQFKF